LDSKSWTLLIVGALAAIAVVWQYQTGTAYDRGMVKYRRSVNPGYFWFLISLYSVFALVMIAIAIRHSLALPA
jgi:hypothetical protein